MTNENTPKKSNKEPRSPWLVPLPIILVVLTMLFGSYWLFSSESSTITLTYGELINILKTEEANVRFDSVRVGRREIRGKFTTKDEVSGVVPEDLVNGKLEKQVNFRTPIGERVPDNAELNKLLLERVGADLDVEEEETFLRGLLYLFTMFMMLLFVGLIGVVLIRWMMGGNSPFSFGRSRHKLYAEKDLAITFKDVAGIDEAVAELREIVDFLKNPDRYQVLGGRIPKGVLLVGPPGTGKTLLARAVAGEADVPFFSMSGSDFVEMFVGVGASRVRDLFGQAESRAPCIIFIDELDALGKTRGAGAIGGHDEREQTLNALLVEMDGFDSNRGVIIMAATNRPETLDAALLRPGRFDRNVVVDRPDLNGREAILKVHTRNVKLGDDVDLRHIASLTPGSAGADLANLVNEAALLAARKNKNSVDMADLEEAIERSTVGLERKSRIMNEDEKHRVAYHEAGHALVSCALPNTDPVHKVSIIPRGIGALGYVVSRPEEERFLITQTELESRIKVALGGTIAEELIFGEISNGATNDLEQANHIARRMVKEFGMSPMGRISFPDTSSSPFLPGAGLHDAEPPYSEETAREIDQQVRQIINHATENVRSLLKERRPALEAVAKQLIEKEVIDGKDLLILLQSEAAGGDGKMVNGASQVEQSNGTLDNVDNN